MLAQAEAVRNNYSGYNFDNELRGKFTESSWNFLRGYGKPWVAFIDQARPAPNPRPALRGAHS